MQNPVDFIRAYPDKKFWTLYDSKDKKVADFTGEGGDGVQEFEKFYGMISDGNYRLCVHKSERLDRGCYSLKFNKTSTTMAGTNTVSAGMPSDYILTLVAENARNKVLIEMYDKRLYALEHRIEQLAKAIDELTDDDESNDDTGLSRLKNDFGDMAGLAVKAKTLFK